MRTEIAGRLAEALGESAPSELRFRPGPLPEPPAAPVSEAPKRPPEPSPEAGREAASAAAAIADPELREMVERAARASLSRTEVRPRFLVDCSAPAKWLFAGLF